MGTNYNKDVIAWSQEQAALLRSGHFSSLDIEHIAQEIEDVGKSEQRELANRMAILLAHLLKWQFQSQYQCASWQTTIKVQRMGIEKRMKRIPSLKPILSDLAWREEIWADAIAQAVKETGLAEFPESCEWTNEEILAHDFYPN